MYDNARQRRRGVASDGGLVYVTDPALEVVSITPPPGYLVRGFFITIEVNET